MALAHNLSRAVYQSIAFREYGHILTLYPAQTNQSFTLLSSSTKSYMEYFNINDPKIKSRLIIDNELAFAFPSKMPIVPGHILICPKRHVSKIDDLTPDEIRSILLLQKELKQSMIKAFQAEGFNYAWNEGKIAGQSVNHLHLHMLPRKKSDAGILKYEPRKFLYRPGESADSPEQELIEIARLIKRNL